MTPARSLPLVALALVVAVGVVNVRLVVGGRTWDDVRYHAQVAPPRLAAAEAVQSGELPAWWDGTGLGVPLLGDPGHGAMYPPLWIARTPRALDLTMLLHLMWAALGVAVWARRRSPPATTGVSDSSAVVAGLLAATTGLFASAAVRGALPGLAHLPWAGAAAAWLGTAADRRDRMRAALALAALIGAIGLVGELAVLADALALIIALAIRKRTLGWLTLAIGAGLALSAPQWIPAALELGHGAGATVAGLPLARLLELIIPGSFGSSDPARAIAAIAGPAPWAPSLFAGAPLLALAAVRSPSRRLLGVLAGLAVAALVVGRGGWPAWLGAPELHVAAFVIILAPRAGVGIDAIVAGDRRAVLALGAAAGCSVIALGALFALRSRHPDAAPAIDRALLDGTLGLLCIAGVIVLAWRTPGRWMPLALTLLVLPGIGAMPSLAPTTDRGFVVEPPAFATEAEGASRPVRVYRPRFMQDHAETVEDAISTFAGASAWRWGIAAAHSEDPARLPDHDRVWLAASQEGGALLDRFGIELAILPRTVAAALQRPQLAQRGRWVLVAMSVAPVAAVLRGWQWAVAPEDAIPLMFAPGGGTNVLRGTVVLRGTGTPQGDRGPPVACTIQTWTRGDIDLVCAPDRDGYAVVSSSPGAGWRVSVDGRDADWLTADVLRRAVAIGPGMHHVRWHYTAPGARIGLLVAAIGILGLAAVGLASRRAIVRT